MKNNRLGILLIVSSLAAIAVLIWLSLLKQHETKMEQIRVQGMGVVRSLSALPYEMLVPGDQGTSVLQSLFMFYKPDDFAYGAISTRDGKLLHEVVRPGVITPSSALPPNTQSLFEERTLESSQSNRAIREFYGQIKHAGQEPAFVRIGYFEPRHTIAGEEISFFAMLALTSFLLVPIIYFIFNRELQPLRSAYQKLEESISEKGNALVPEKVGSMDFQSFATRLYSYVQDTSRRLADLSHERDSLLTKNRLLEYGNTKLNFVLQSFPDGLIVLDPAGNITFSSAKVGAILGIELESILSGGLDDWCANQELKSLLLRFQSYTMQASRSETIEFSACGGQEKRIRAIAQPLIAANEGPAFGTLVVLQDVTREYAAQCASQEFVAHVSHELKSPLNVILMYCEMLQSAGTSDESLHIEATNVIHDEVERMTTLVNNLLNISKVEVGGFKLQQARVKIEDLLQDIYSNALPKAKSNGISLKLNIAREVSAVSVDKDMFRIAVNNLVSNAIKYNDKGGSIVLAAKEENASLVISVEDTGIGIPLEEQADVFKKFVRAKGANSHQRSGHGLGLYLANEIVLLHNGHITLESTPAKGSKFSIYLKAYSGNELNLI